MHDLFFDTRGAHDAEGGHLEAYAVKFAQMCSTPLVESRSSSSGADRYRLRAETETKPICAPVSPSRRSSRAALLSPRTL